MLAASYYALGCHSRRLQLSHIYHTFQGHLAAAPTSSEAAAGNARGSSSSSTAGGNSTLGRPPAVVPDGVIVLPMPSLSHAMVSGKVKKWLKHEGEHCNMYDLLLEVETETLVEEAYRLDDFAGKVTLLIEANEECWLAKQLLQEGKEVPVGQAIALLSEEPDGMKQAAEQAPAVAKIGSVYAEEEKSGRTIRTLVWQSYLKESSKERGSSCGCM